MSRGKWEGEEEEEKIGEECCVKDGGWESKRQTRPDCFYLPLTPCLSLCVFVYVSVRVPSPQPDNRAGSVPDWGQLVAAQGRGRKSGREEGVVCIRHHCLTCCLEGNREGSKIRWAYESLMKNEKHRGRRWEEDKEKDSGNQRLLFLTPTHILYHLTPGWEVKLG